MFDDRIFQPYYIKANNGVNVGFILSVLICSKIEALERQIIYIFYMCNIIPHEFLKNKREKIGENLKKELLGFQVGIHTIQPEIYVAKLITDEEIESNQDFFEQCAKDYRKLDKEFLLKLIFELSAEKKIIPKKDLRFLTTLEDKGTFNKYFGEHINRLGLSRNKLFTLYETFQILKFWQGDDKWGRMAAFSKGELANRFMEGNYDELELKMTDKVFNYDEYRHHDFIKPADAKRFINEVLDKESLELIYEEEFDVDYLTYFFIMYFLYSFRSKKKKTLN